VPQDGQAIMPVSSSFQPPDSPVREREREGRGGVAGRGELLGASVDEGERERERERERKRVEGLVLCGRWRRESRSAPLLWGCERELSEGLVEKP